ncbi:hypothetical protein T484DRAFT_1854426, partial [Baffinella frigidus]
RTAPASTGDAPHGGGTDEGGSTTPTPSGGDKKRPGADQGRVAKRGGGSSRVGGRTPDDAEDADFRLCLDSDTSVRITKIMRRYPNCARTLECLGRVINSECPTDKRMEMLMKQVTGSEVGVLREGMWNILPVAEKNHFRDLKTQDDPGIAITDEMQEGAALTCSLLESPHASLLQLIRQRARVLDSSRTASIRSVNCKMQFCPLFKFQLHGKETLTKHPVDDRVLPRDFNMTPDSESTTDSNMDAIPRGKWLSGTLFGGVLDYLAAVLGVAHGTRSCSAGIVDGVDRRLLWLMDEGSTVTEERHKDTWTAAADTSKLSVTAMHLHDGNSCGFIALLDVAEDMVGCDATATDTDADRLRDWMWETILEVSKITELDGVHHPMGGAVLPSIERHLSATWGWFPPRIVNPPGNNCVTAALFQVLAAVPGLATSVVSSLVLKCDVVVALKDALLKLQTIEGTDTSMDVNVLHSALVAAAVGSVSQTTTPVQTAHGHQELHDLLAVLAERLPGAGVCAMACGSMCGACNVVHPVTNNMLARPDVVNPIDLALHELLDKWGDPGNQTGSVHVCSCGTAKPKKNIIQLSTAPDTLVLMIRRNTDGNSCKITTSVRPLEILNADDGMLNNYYFAQMRKGVTWGLGVPPPPTALHLPTLLPTVRHRLNKPATRCVS